MTCVLFCGCQSTTTISGGPVIAPQPGGAQDRPAATEHAQPAAARGMAEEGVRSLNVVVDVSGGSDDTVSAVRDRVEGALADSGYTLRQPADLGVKVRVSDKAMGKMGNYVKYQGRADAAVQRVHDSLVMGKKTFSVIGERKLGDDEARQAMADALTNEIGSWLPGIMAMERAGLAARDVTVNRAWQEGKDTQYANLFAARVKALDGVANCTLVDQDYSARKMVFRVVYLKEKMPAGLVNRIAAINDLNLTAKD